MDIIDRTYGYECPICHNLSVDYDGEKLYCFACNTRFSFQDTNEIISKKMKASELFSTLGLVLFLLLTLKVFHLKYRFVINGTKLVSYIGVNGEDEEVVHIPGFVTQIGKCAFMNHKGIKQIILISESGKMEKHSLMRLIAN